MADWTQAAAKIAANGAPAIGNLIGLALGGPAGAAGGGAIGSVFGNLIGQALGVPPEPQAISEAIDKDPAGAAEKLQAVEAAHKSDAELAAEDVINARAMEVELAKAGSPLQYGPMVISTIVVLTFCSMAVWIMGHDVKPSELVSMIVGVVIARFGTVVDFYVGSSNSSHNKDGTIAAALAAAAQSVRRR